MTLDPLWLLGFLALGALIFAAGGIGGAALAWRFQGREGGMLESKPKGAMAPDMPTETE